MKTSTTSLQQFRITPIDGLPCLVWAMSRCEAASLYAGQAQHRRIRRIEQVIDTRECAGWVDERFEVGGSK